MRFFHFILFYFILIFKLTIAKKILEIRNLVFPSFSDVSSGSMMNEKRNPLALVSSNSRPRPKAGTDRSLTRFIR